MSAAADQLLGSPPHVSVASRLLAGRRALVRSGGIVLGATLVWHASNFAFNSVAARLLGPAAYSELAASVALLYVASPVLVSVQTVSSRTTTALSVAGEARMIRTFLRRFVVRLALIGAVAATAAIAVSDLVARALHIGSRVAVAVVLCGLAISLVTHCQRGVMQGAARFGRYATSTVVEGVAKVVGAAGILIAFDRNVDGAAAAVPLAAVCALVANVALLRFLPNRGGTKAHRVAIERGSAATVATFVLLAMLLSADVLAAKRYLPPHQAGLYAAISLCGKTTFFATSAVSLFLFPLFSEQRERGQRASRLVYAAMSMVLAASALLAASYYAAPEVVVGPLFGTRYSAAEPYVGTIAVAFGGYAVMYLSATYLLARRSRAGAWLLAIITAVQVGGLVIDHATVGAIVHVQLLVLGAGAAAMVAAVATNGKRT